MGTLAAGIKEIFATAKTTGSNVMLCGNDGTPDGHMTMDNLALVLGSGNVTTLAGNTDWNNLQKGKWYLKTTNSVMQNAPDTGRSLLVYTDYEHKGTVQGGIHLDVIYQYAISPTGNYGYFRTSWAGEWGAWTELLINANNYTNLSSLANALGVTKQMEFVDLGLPSGTLWASKNLGAETPEDYGYYFSWGNVIGRKPNGTTFDYDWGTNNDGNYASTPGAALTGDIPTNMDYDAVQRYMGGSCKMPEKNQFVELFNSSYTTNEWTTKNGVNGRLVTSKINSNSIFFPAAGYGSGSSLYGAGSNGYYWSRSRGSSANGYNLGFSSSGVNPQDGNSRFNGFSVRAVQ